MSPMRTFRDQSVQRLSHASLPRETRHREPSLASLGIDATDDYFRRKRLRIVRLTRQYELDIITRQNEAAPRRPISKISIQNFEKVENLNSRIWKIVVQGIHITKYLRICNPSREWQTFQIQIGRLGAASYWRVNKTFTTLLIKLALKKIYIFLENRRLPKVPV